MVGRIRCATSLSLLSQFSLGDGLAYRAVVLVTRLVLEELLSGLHHLLIVTNTRWCLSLIDQIEKMSLLLSTTNISGSTTTVIISLDRLTEGRDLSRVLSALLACVGGPELRHEVTVEHSLPHLLCVRVVLLLKLHSKRTHSCLIEASNGLVRALLVCPYLLPSDVGKHVVDSRIIGGLQHDALLGGVHFINAKWSLMTVTLTFYPISHKKGLIRLTSHHARALRSGRLRLSTSEVGSWLLPKTIH